MSSDNQSPLDMIRVTGLTKSFTLHNQGGLRLPVFADVNLTVSQGECLISPARRGRESRPCCARSTPTICPRRGR